jgi:hypothetical protein
MPKKCKSCDGTFEPTQRDGSQYFHACAPIPNPALQPDPGKPAYDPRETVERPNKRDENIDDSPAAVKAAPRDANGNPLLGPKAAGAGVQ